ncbi:hypothetical protein QW131_10790 [Roseibium salinum]|nr:hypothetical protein [Roseibium salinum]
MPPCRCCSRGEKAVDITTSHVIRGNTRVFFTGEVEPDVEGTSEWGIRLDSKYPQFGPADVAEAPHMLDGIQLRGRFDPEERMLNIDRFTARSGKAVIHGVGSLQLTSEGPNLALAAEGEQIPVALAKQVWPITLVPPARRWIIERDRRRDDRQRFLYGRNPASRLRSSEPGPGLVGRRHACRHDFLRCGGHADRQHSADPGSQGDAYRSG